MKNGHILLVEDDKDYAALTAEVLREAGFRVTVAHDGGAAQQILKEVDLHVDLVITDIMMDYLSEGFDLSRLLRNQPATRDIPIVILSAVRRVYDVEVEVGEDWYPCDAFLEKPIDPHVLVRTVSSLLQTDVPHES